MVKKCEVTINGKVFVPKEDKEAATRDGMEYCIVRTYSAGVFAGYIKSRVGQEVEMIEARRLWKWVGASELSQIAQEGIKDIKNSRIAMPTKVTLLQVIEIQPCTESARDILVGAPEWKV